MSDDSMSQSTAEIESLLADRDRLQGWLDRLNDASASAPPAVRDRVRADYEGRLAEVVARLGSFTTALETSLESLRSQLAHLGDLRVDAEEARAEAALRHGVGEYSDEEWRQIEDEAAAKIGGLSTDIGRLEDEASRLEEVLAQVVPAAMTEPEAMAAPVGQRAPGDDVEVEPLESEAVLPIAPAASPDEEASVGHAEPEAAGPGESHQEAGRPFPVEAPRFTPKGGGIERPPIRERPSRTLRFPSPAPEPAAPSPVDEMTFLKSVTLESQPASETLGEPRAATRTSRSGTSAAKTLKCTDCGAMNRPTEWYCERCGAELAAL